ncbi:MAG: helix-hairpin-helix domain-containing protein [Proteobacteria bacterium]|nr:helix-hairpin-helix domain-containing protein [Pseudomonadota bacterium]
MRTALRFLAVLMTVLAVGVPSAFAADAMGQAKPKTGNEFTSTDRINVNTASVAQLAKIPGLDETKAKAIVAYRDKHGPFMAFHDLSSVAGIDPMDVDGLSQYLLAE